MRSFFLFLSCLSLFALPAYARPLKIVVSFSILADLTHAVAAHDAQIRSLIGPDSDAHTYEPTPADLRAIAEADVLVVNGLGLEGWLDRMAQSSDFKGRLIVASRGIHPRMLGATTDPHAWQSVPNGMIYIENIREGLGRIDAAHEAFYARNARVYTARLVSLESWVQAQIATVKAQKRYAITSHDALGYFAEHYGVTFIAPLGLTTSGDISAGGMARLIDQIRSGHVRAVFLENMSDPRLIRQLVSDAGAVIGGTLYSDALSSPDGPAPDYIAMFHHNVSALAEAMRKN